jgi:hypothetical protein
VVITRDVNRFWSSWRKLKSSRQIDADSPLRPGVAQGSQKLWSKWCKILHSRPLLTLNFIIETSFFCTIFLIFSAIVQDKRPFFTCWLQRCIKILFLQCNLTWKTEQLTNYKCSLIQYGDENDPEVLLCTDLLTLTIFWAILRPYDCCQFPYDSANLRYFRFQSVISLRFRIL